ncbi:histidine phosphatase family protein [Pseudomonas koreensis]|uniref:lipopolysaccharide core heptose(II)-phosphate phosphatase PmrG n=1 Tax=Pseudomonas koreensis TaxID=198620 RepID=UPI0021C92DFE|nr:histidine phosphatase family protein [Pseudomonas koreensis]MCU0070527.1 histidine phosphatase family protein [Pseudomonas koreensis]
MQLAATYKQRRARRPRTLLTITGSVLAAALVSGFVWWPKSPLDLAHADKAITAEWTKAWQAGEVVALVRHTERCDRSDNLCLGPADGITRVGSTAAAAVGKGFEHLGMQQAQVLSSPLTRTAQTAHFMFGQDASTQDWLATCGPTLRDDVVAHKVAQHNLVLVTHSGCISDFEKQTGFPHAAGAEYGSTLFVRINEKGQLKVLGVMNADAWPAVRP